MIRIGDQRDSLGESPLWDAADQVLYWIDIRRPALRRFDPATGQVETRPMPAMVGSIALATPGRLLVARADQVVLYDWAVDQQIAVATLPSRIPGHRFNDGRCDRQGRFWVGTMHNETRAPEGVLYRLEPGGELLPMRGGICIPNSLAWSPDGFKMYFSDSLAYEITCHDYDPATGTPGPPRRFAATEKPGFPDGSAIDADGCLWNAEFNASRVVRYAPDGQIDRVIELPVANPTCCAFGGENLDTLFVTTASQAMTPAQLEAQPLAGALLAFSPGVRGIAEPRWNGDNP